MKLKENNQSTIDQYFLSEKEKLERTVYERIVSYGGAVILNRRSLEASSKAIFGVDFQTLDSVLHSLYANGIADILPPKILMRTTLSRHPKGWRSHEDTQVFLKVWISAALKKIQSPQMEKLLTP